MTCPFSSIIPFLGIVLCCCHMVHAAELDQQYTTSGYSTLDENHHVHNASVTSKTALLSIFAKYGQNSTLSFEGFEHLLVSIGLGNIAFFDHNISEHHRVKGSWSVELHNDHQHSHADLRHEHHDQHPPVSDLDAHNGVHEHHASSAVCTNCLSSKCLKPADLLSLSGLSPNEYIRPQNLIDLCPSLMLQLDSHVCDTHRHDEDIVRHHIHDHRHHHHHNHDEHSRSHDRELPRWPTAAVWGFSLLSCLVISAVGLVAVAIIPVMHRVIYNHLLQFLVALAIGSLTGDAVLHLLPHALTGHSAHDHEGEGHDHRAVWYGLTTLSGIYLFFVVERVVGLCSERKRTQNEHRMQMQKLDDTDATVTNASLITNRTSVSQQPDTMTSSLPRHLNDARNPTKRLSRHTDTATSCEEILMTVHTNKDVRKFADDAHDEVHQHCDPKMKEHPWGHHSSGGHNHSHSVPGSVAAVAWMVIVGDGFHNFADGLAIGSAFASSLTGGLSTSIAVFCHELPHELGDFAMLLNAGMSAKQALVYNCVSSVLCMLGMVCGVAVGNVNSATSWIFALIAGLFLYIALVDMLPEMTSVGPKKGEHPLLHLALQNSGMLVGASIMLIIAVYEEQLQQAFSPGPTLNSDDTMSDLLTTAIP